MSNLLVLIQSKQSYYTMIKKLSLVINILVIGCTNPSSKDITHHTKDTASSEKLSTSQKHKNLNHTITSNYHFDSLSTITGLLELESYFGPPGFGENPKTDAKLNTWILKLKAPIRVIGPNHVSPISNITEIQLNPKQLDLAKYKGYEVKLKGKLYHAHTGFHIKQVLMTVENVLQ